MPRYQFVTQALDDEAGSFLNELAAAHASKFRPRCLCQTPNPEMYVAKVGDSFIVKRMPGTGIAHDSGCDHFDPPLAFPAWATCSAVRSSRRKTVIRY